MVQIPQHMRRKILSIARTARREALNRFCSSTRIPSTGICSDASDVLWSLLKEEKISSQVVNGYWIGPLREDYADEDDVWWWTPEEGPPGHTWIKLPQYDDAILDITADQFSSRIKAIEFPAPKKFYSTTKPRRKFHLGH